VVLAGILVATLVVHIISVVLGGGLGRFLPTEWIALAAGLAFLGFGLWTLKGDELEDENCGVPKKRISPFWLVTTTFFIAELGDKTMLSTVTLATAHTDVFGLVLVWLGSSLGMVISDGLAILVGILLGKNLPERAVKFGLWKVVEAGRIGLPAYAWPIAIVTTAAMLAWFLIGLRRDRLRAAEAGGRPQLTILPTRHEEPAGTGSA
jgi:putative Ca2+/H+ antiporter (TMEM165/GDT1 family)